MIFISSSISSSLELGSVNPTSLYENSELNIVKNITFVSDIPNNSPNDLLGTNLHKTLEFYW